MASVIPPVALWEAFFPSFAPLRIIMGKYLTIDTLPYVATGLDGRLIAMAFEYIGGIFHMRDGYSH